MCLFFEWKKGGGGNKYILKIPFQNSRVCGASILWTNVPVSMGVKKNMNIHVSIYIYCYVSLSLSLPLSFTHTHIQFLCLTLPIQSPARKEKRISSKSPFIILGIVAPQWVWNVSHIKWLYCENLSNGSKVSNASNVVPTEHSWYSTSVLWRILCHNTEAPQSSLWGGFE